LLSAHFSGQDGVSRIGSLFKVERPWGLALFGPTSFASGWWVLECEGDTDTDLAEVRLTCGAIPLIVICGDQAAGLPGATRIHLHRQTTIHVSLQVRAWPGATSFRKLKLRRQNPAENISLILERAARALRSPDRFARLMRVLKNLSSPPAVQISQGTSERERGRAATWENSPSEPFAEDALQWAIHGDIGVLAGPKDVLDPRALNTAMAEFQRSPNVRVAYCDVLIGGRPVLRPGWNPELFRYWTFTGTPLFVRGARKEDSRDPSHVVNEVLRRHGPNAVAHIPLPVASRPSERRQPLPPVPTPALSRTPKVSVIVPTKVRIDLLEKCLLGLQNATSYPDLEVVVVDNGSTDARLPRVLAQASRRLNLISFVDNNGFNFSRLINDGVRRSTGEVVVVFNDDIEPIQADWLHRMVESVLRSDVGAIGARLIYPDGSIQHAGVVLGVGGIAGHLWKGMSAGEAASSPYVMYPGERQAVTGACLAVRRELFDRLGGLDENYPVALNDIDFCLRAREAGYHNIYRGDAVLIHHESQSRGVDLAPAARQRAAAEGERFLSRWRDLTIRDPFGFPGADPRTETGQPHRAGQAGMQKK
jgi:GT2 family glycosyltransferase